MRKKITYLFLTFLGASLLTLAGCSQKKSWKFKDTITLQDHVHPMSIVDNGGQLWISAPAGNKILQINEQGERIEQRTDLPRPMHITSVNGKIYIPLYLKDRIVRLEKARFDTLNLGLKPDAPAGISVKGDTLAVADFYNHRIILQTGNQTKAIGEKGHGKGQLFYPTDVEIAGDKIYVADAYNNRVQVFDFNGKSLQIIGANDGINVATGIAVYHKELFVTDFFGNKILVYDLNGKLKQTLTGHFEKPTDISAINGELYIPNYGGYSVVRYGRE